MISAALFRSRKVPIVTLDESPAVLARRYKFNPGFQTDAEAINTFVVRQQELEAVLAIIRSNTGAHKIKHVLITAPRGAGKTTLVRRVLAEIRTSEVLGEGWSPIFLGEESYTITTPGEFFLECLFHLQDQLKRPQWNRAYSGAMSQSDETALLKSALGALRRFAHENGKRLVLIVENFQMILTEQIGDQAKKLQHTIDSEPMFMVLATSVRDASATEIGNLQVLSDYAPIPLRPLDLTECQQLWAALTHQDVKPECIRPLQILTGGSPRLMRIMAEFTVAPSLQNLLENLNLLIDQNTEYFKSQLDGLPSTERKVFAALLDIWDPSTAKEVAEQARVNVNIASAMLGRLTDRGVVIKLPGKGRSATYHAAERLFNIYYLMRRRSHPSNRVRALVAFMTQYYRGEELINTTAKLVAEACALPLQKRDDYHSAFSAILAHSPGEVRDQILRQTREDFLAAITSGTSANSALGTGDRDNSSRARSARRATMQPANKIQQSQKVVLDEVRRLLSRDDHKGVEKRVRDALANDQLPPKLWIDLAFVLHREAKKRMAIDCVRKAISLAPTDATLHAIMAMLLKELPDTDDEVTEHVKLALKNDPDNAIGLIASGDVKHSQKDFVGASEDYKKAWSAHPDWESALTNLASVLAFHLHQQEKAEELLRDALHKQPKWSNARDVLARTLLRRNQTKEAEAVLREGLAIDGKSPNRWADFGWFLSARLGDQVKAKAAFQTALKLKPKDPRIWSGYARILKKSGASIADVFEAANKAAQLGPTLPGVWRTLGDLHEEYGQFQEAEQVFRKVVSLDRKSPRAWYDLGVLLQKMPGRNPEAEEALRNAHGSGQDFPCAVPKELAALLIHKGDDKEAARLLQEAININKDCYCSMTLLAGVASRNHDLGGAKSYFKRALSVKDHGIEAMAGLAQLLVEEGVELDLAHSLISKAMAANAHDAKVLMASALLKKAQGDVAGCLDDLRKALEFNPKFLEAKLFLASIEASGGNADAALAHLTQAMPSLADRRELVSGVVDAAVSLARQGRAKAIFDAIRNVGVVEYLEPLDVALRLTLGEKPRVAKEIYEVAKDIVAKIEDSGSNSD